MYKRLLRPLLFKSDPETIHHRVFSWLKFINKLPGKAAVIRGIYKVSSPKLKVQAFGIEFPNPVGLAAGFDKDGKLYNELGNFGFGFIELGTVTPRPQAGNPKPRMFRLPEDKALINRMGFNNEGVDALKKRLLHNPPKGIIIGGNIGKNKDTPNEKALDDYLYCFKALHEVVDYFVVNVSSPNTPGLRNLQEKGPLLHILQSLQVENEKSAAPKPILLKIAPDLSRTQLDDILEIVSTSRISGIIATNTTIDRGNLKSKGTLIENIGMGGLSGKPLTDKSTEVIKYLAEKANKQLTIIAAGGIFTADDAIQKIKAGASLVQVYTGFIYEGPSIVKKINKGILKSK